MFLRHCITFSLIALLAGCAGFGSREALQGQGSPQSVSYTHLTLPTN